MAKAEMELVIRGKTAKEWAKYDAVIRFAQQWCDGGSIDETNEALSDMAEAVAALESMSDG